MPHHGLDASNLMTTHWTNRRNLVRLAGLLLVVGFVASMRIDGARDAVHASLIDTGFDPGRAYLIGALLVAALAAALAALATGLSWLSVLLGTAAGVLDDAGAFRRETLDALRASGRDGTFDPV